MADAGNDALRNRIIIGGALTLLAKTDWQKETDIDVIGKDADGKSSSKKLVEVTELAKDKDGKPLVDEKNNTIPQRVTIHSKDGDHYFTCLDREADVKDDNHGLRFAAWRETDKEHKPIDNKIYYCFPGYSSIPAAPILDNTQTNEARNAVAVRDHGTPNPQMFVAEMNFVRRVQANLEPLPNGQQYEAVCIGHSMGAQAAEFVHIGQQLNFRKSTLVALEPYGEPLAKQPMHLSETALLSFVGASPLSPVAVPVMSVAMAFVNDRLGSNDASAIRSEDPTQVSQNKPGGDEKKNSEEGTRYTIKDKPASFVESLADGNHYLKNLLIAAANGGELKPVEKPEQMPNGLPSAPPTPAVPKPSQPSQQPSR